MVRNTTDIGPPGVGGLVIDLTGILGRGGIYEGRTLLRVTLEWEGGRLESDLPAVSDDQTETTEAANRLRSRIVAALEESRVALSRKQVAAVLGLKSIGGRFSKEVSTLVETSTIFERKHLLTDDVSKFPDDSCDE